MTDTDIHSCGYYCDRPACIVAQRNELRDKLFSEQAVKTYSGGKPNYTQPIVRITTPEDIAKIKSKWEPILPGGGIGRHPDIQARKEEQGLNATPLPAIKLQDRYDPSENNADYERGFIDGQQKQIESAVHQAVKRIQDAMTTPSYYIPNKDKKEWVGLTDEELLDLADMAYANDLELLQTLQAKLKEKNNG